METLRCPEGGSTKYKRIEIDELTTEWSCRECGFYYRSKLEFRNWKKEKKESHPVDLFDYPRYIPPELRWIEGNASFRPWG